MRLRAFLLALLLMAIVLPLPTHGDSGDCAGAAPIRLAVGVTARVSFQNRYGVLLRENPGERFRRGDFVRNGSTVKVVGGPTCSDEMQWWQVRSADGANGWLSEGDEAAYQIEPWPTSLEIVRQVGTNFKLFRISASDGIARLVREFPYKAISGSIRDVFPAAEWKPLETSLARCPAKNPPSKPNTTIAADGGLSKLE